MGRFGKYGWIVIPLVLVLLATPALAIDGQSTAPDESLSYKFRDAVNFTPANKVVIVIADNNDYNIIALADLVARMEGAPLFITLENKLDPQVVEIVQQLMDNRNIENAIVVGVGSNASEIADLIGKISVPGTELTVTRIIANDVYELSTKVAVYEFTSASGVVITDGNVPEDLAKGLAIALNDSIPLIYEQVGFENINATLQLLGVSTVYTTPAVEAPLEGDLADAGYTVNTSWRNVDLTKSLDVILAETQPAKNATIVVASEEQFIQCAGVVGVNASILMTNSTTVLGNNTSSYLSTVKPLITVIMGNNSIITDQVALDIAAATGGKVERLFFTNDYMMINRLGLIEAAYVYPVIVVDNINVTNSHYTYIFRNIGFSDAVRYGEYAVKVTFTKTTGTFENAVPSPIFQNETKVVFYYTNPVYPYDTFTIEFDISPGTEFNTYPDITYNAITLAGAIISLESYVSYLVEKVQEFKNWFVDMFQNFFGLIKSYIPLPGIAATIVAAIIIFLIFWTIIGAIAYVIKVYVMKKPVTMPAYYGPIGWILGRRG